MQGIRLDYAPKPRRRYVPSLWDALTYAGRFWAIYFAVVTFVVGFSFGAGCRAEIFARAW